MGKKIAFGCLGIAVLVFVVGGFFGYTFFVKPMMGGVSALLEIHEKNEQIVNRSSYSPPPDGELSQNQVGRFVAVQQEIRQGLENVLTEFQEKYDELGAELDDRDPTIREMMNVYGDLVRLYSGAKQAQIDALNKHGFSLDEYRFVQQSFYQALGVELFSYNIDMIAKAAHEGHFNINADDFETIQAEMEEVPERNLLLVAPYADSSEDWLIFAWWGL